jgi:hypothetical protein
MEQALASGETIMPARLAGLWAQVREWAGYLGSLFDLASLRTRGVKRERAARLSIWLGGVESAVRRLILMAALALSPTLRNAPGVSSPHTNQRPSPRTPGLRIFRLASGGAGRPHAASSPHEPKPHDPKPYGHIPFPSDPLLRLGPAPERRACRSRRPRTPNPLDPQVRLDRRHPDWTPQEGEPLYVFLSDPRPSIWRPRPPRAPHDPEALPDSLWDWRRCHDEWQRLIPAPRLADRIAALQRLAEDPSALIASTARRLRTLRAAVLPLAKAARPNLRVPTRVAHIQTAGHAERLAGRSHAELDACDTS